MYGKEFNSYPRSQFLMEAGRRDYAAKAKNSERDWYPNLKGRAGEKNRECDIEDDI